MASLVSRVALPIGGSKVEAAGAPGRHLADAAHADDAQGFFVICVPTMKAGLHCRHTTTFG